VKFPSPDKQTPMSTKVTLQKIAADEEECPSDGKQVRSQPVSTNDDTGRMGLTGMLTQS
jgi:hypothetical protein